MSRQLEAKLEARIQREKDAVLAAIYGGLVDGVERMGGELLGFSVKLSPGDCLMTLRAEFPGGRMVCFVGGEEWAVCLRRAVREAGTDAMKWRQDKFAR